MDYSWTGLWGFIVGCIGVLVSGGSWLWAVKAGRAARGAKTAADQAKQAVESLTEKFQREADESAKLFVFRAGDGVILVNQSNEVMRGVGVGPLDDSLDMNELVYLGELQPLGSVAGGIAEAYPSWRTATVALVYWRNERNQRRFDSFPIRDADPAVLASYAKEA